MARIVYQTSRWQLLTYLNDTIRSLSRQQQASTEQSKLEPGNQGLRRKQEYLTRAASTAERHITGPEVLQEPSADSDEAQSRPSATVGGALDFTPGNRRRDSLLSKVSGRYSFMPMDNGGEIRGIPREAQIGHDFHIY